MREVKIAIQIWAYKVEMYNWLRMTGDRNIATLYMDASVILELEHHICQHQQCIMW